jgi:SRSO17 transposase
MKEESGCLESNLEQQLYQANKQMKDVLDYCRMALEPFDDVKPRSWKTDSTSYPKRIKRSVPYWAL